MAVIVRGNINIGVSPIFKDQKNKFLSVLLIFKNQLKFLSNEIRADGINVIIHKKTCEEKNKCIIKKIDSTLAGEIKLAILREAAILSQKDIEKNKVPYSMPGVFKSER